MVYRVTFKEKKLQCCPPKYYWVTKESNIVAHNEKDIFEKLKQGRHAIEIKDIQPID